MTAALRILATAPVPPIAATAFSGIGTIGVADGDLERALSTADILLVRGTPVDAAVLDAAPRLRLIARTGAGYDGVDVAAATRRGIPVLVAPGAGTVPVAEGTLALMLAAAKRLEECARLVRTGQWRRRYEVEGADLRGSTLGIVGFGSIGQEVARLALAFGMEVVAHDPAFAPPADLAVVTPVALAELVAAADVITLHCALTAATRGLVDRALLASAKPGAILVNVARGAIVAGDDVLLEALERGWLSAVALDVFGSEPPDPDHPLLAHPRVVCTPHNVGLTARWNRSVFMALADGVGRVLRGECPQHVVNPDAFDQPAVAG